MVMLYKLLIIVPFKQIQKYEVINNRTGEELYVDEADSSCHNDANHFVKKSFVVLLIRTNFQESYQNSRDECYKGFWSVLAS